MILPILLLFTATELSAADREDAIASLIQCAAFHSVEADLTGDSETAAEPHRATARDFVNLAVGLAGRAKMAAVEADLAAVEREYRDGMQKGNARQVASDWTALESACADLHKIKDKLNRAASGDEETR